MMKLNYLQFWTIVACILLIILASVFFFLSDKINGSDKINFIQDRTDSLFITTYKPPSNLITAKLSQPVDSMPVVNVNKDTIADKKIKDPNKPAVQWHQKNEDYQNIVVDQDLESHNDYSLSNSEIQAILAGEKWEEKAGKSNVVNNFVQTSRPVAGTKAFNDYVQKNRRSLTDEDCASQHGKVILLFKVDESVHPVDITVFRSLCQAADKEAMRLLQNGPDWTTSGDHFARLELNF